MRERALRRLCRRLLCRLDLTFPLDVEQLCARLGEDRGRPIRLVAHPLAVPGPLGLWIGTDDADHIVYQQETTRAHQEHIILHEIGHLLAGHESDHAGFALLGDWGRAGPEAAPRRTAYDSCEEWEAETIATLIKEWVAVRERTELQAGPATAGLTDALCDRRGWL